MNKAFIRPIVFGVLAVALVGAGYLNYRFNNQTPVMEPTILQASPTPTLDPNVTPTPVPKGEEGASDPSQTTFFDAYRDQRKSTREQEAQYLNQIISDQTTDESTRKTAQETLLQVTTSMEKELTVEGLLKSKGFGEAVATIHEGSVNIVVGTADLTDAQVAQILDIVRSETGEKAENIKIIPASN